MMKDNIGFKLIEGREALIIVKKFEGVPAYFKGYMFGIPEWSDKTDAVIFKDAGQCIKFSKSLINSEIIQNEN